MKPPSKVLSVHEGVYILALCIGKEWNRKDRVAMIMIAILIPFPRAIN